VLLRSCWLFAFVEQDPVTRQRYTSKDVMPRPFHFFPDHEPFFGAAPVPHPPAEIPLPLWHVVKVLRDIVLQQKPLRNTRSGLSASPKKKDLLGPQKH
jgi:hypothetical protein